MYPRDLDAGGSISDFMFGILIGCVIGAGLTYWAIDSGLIHWFLN